jgi:hypothetical protein
MLLNNPNRPINYYSVWRDRRKNIEKSKKVAEKFGRMKGNAYFCRQKVKNETKMMIITNYWWWHNSRFGRS